MTQPLDTQRRQFLKSASLFTLAAMYPPLLLAQRSKTLAKASANFNPDVEIELIQQQLLLPIFSGPKTRIWKVQGQLLKGPKDSVINHQDTYLAPTLNLQQGQKVRIVLHNKLPAASILHWHGLHVPAKMDGNPIYAINSNETFVYEFEVLNRAGTYWYHAHTHSVTAKQVYSGLAGLLIVHDVKEQALNLPTNEYDVAIVIQDRSFHSNNQLAYSNHMMQKMRGFLGDQIFVNGRPDYALKVATRAYRLRLLNGSNSRIYKLAWDDNRPMSIIGTDGGLLEQMEQRPYVMLVPGERLELWVDFSAQNVGDRLSLRSLEFSSSTHGGMMGMGMMGHRGRGMMGGMHANSKLPLGSDYEIMQVHVISKAEGGQKLPDKFTSISRLQPKLAANYGHTRNIKLSMRHMSALLNGRAYKMNDVRKDEIIPVNSNQLISFDNGWQRQHGMMSMPHPMHIHGEQFQIVKRDYQDNNAYRTVAQGFIDEGWKDTVLVMPGEKVTLLKPFNDFKGLFMYHCHNLEHEDMGMMRDFLIT